MIGRTLGRYRILEKLGQGGMGEVYLAEDRDLGRKVALKFLPPEMRGDANAHRRFLREAKSAAALDHPFICHIHETGELEGVAFIAMERVGGETLDAKLSRGRLELAEALRIATEIADALEEAHRGDIVHRDLKPSNVMMTSGGHSKVMDFGLAKKLVAGVKSQADTLTKLTGEGSTVGTVPYMSPEQLRGEEVDTRSDLFSFGILLQEMLTGHHPFRRETAFETANAILRESPPSLAESMDAVPKDLQRLLDQLLTRNREARLQTAKELKSALAGITGMGRSGPFAGRPFSTRAKAATLVAVLVVGLTLWLPYRSRRMVASARASVPEVERLALEGDYVEAYALAIQALEHLPEDPTLERWMPGISDKLTIRTEPEGASVYLQRIPAEEGEATERLLAGSTPLVGFSLPRADHRLWLEKEGFATEEQVIGSAFNRAEGRMGVEPDIVLEESLLPEGTVPDGMVAVEGGDYELRGGGFAGMEPVTLDPFFIDRYEVTSEQYREFIRSGGYTNPAYWTYPIIKDDLGAFLSGGGVALQGSQRSSRSPRVDQSGFPGR